MYSVLASQCCCLCCSASFFVVRGSVWPRRGLLMLSTASDSSLQKAEEEGFASMAPYPMGLIKLAQVYGLLKVAPVLASPEVFEQLVESRCLKAFVDTRDLRR